jgi:hypothetical protein
MVHGWKALAVTAGVAPSTPLLSFQRFHQLLSPLLQRTLIRRLWFEAEWQGI